MCIMSGIGVKISVLLSLSGSMKKILVCGNHTYAIDVVHRDSIEKSWSFPFVF